MDWSDVETCSPGTGIAAQGDSEGSVGCWHWPVEWQTVSSARAASLADTNQENFLEGCWLFDDACCREDRWESSLAAIAAWGWLVELEVQPHLSFHCVLQGSLAVSCFD